MDVAVLRPDLCVSSLISQQNHFLRNITLVKNPNPCETSDSRREGHRRTQRPKDGVSAAFLLVYTFL